MRFLYKIIVLSICIALAGVWVARNYWQTTPSTPHASSVAVAGVSPNTSIPRVDPNTIHETGVPKDGIPSLDRPAFSPVLQSLDELGPDGSGIVVSRGAVVRFYPYQILAWHEVVNDTLDTTPIAVTYCALCNVGVVYDRQVQGKVLDFGVSGKVHELDSLLYDRATGSLWSQVTGSAIEGALSGVQLAIVPSTVMKLQDFAKQYPRSQVLSKFTGFVRNYDSLSYGDYATRPEAEAVIARKGLVHPKTEVVGIALGEVYKAYPLELLDQKKTVTDTVANKKLRLGFADGRVLVEELSSTGAIPVDYIRTYWFMWQSYHPETEIYK